MAAGIALGVLALIAWRSSRETHGINAGIAPDLASAAEFLATMAPEEVEDALASFSVSGFEARMPGDVFATHDLPTDPGAAEGSASSQVLDEVEGPVVDGPVERLGAELLENLSESDQRELVRRIQEASS